MQNTHHRKIDGHLDRIERYLRHAVPAPRARCDPPSLDEVPRITLPVHSNHEDAPLYGSTDKQVELRANLAYRASLPYTALSRVSSTLDAPPPTHNPTVARTTTPPRIASAQPLPSPLIPISTSWSKEQSGSLPEATPPHAAAPPSSRSKASFFSKRHEAKRLCSRYCSNTSNTSSAGSVTPENRAALAFSATDASGSLGQVRWRSPPPQPPSPSPFRCAVADPHESAACGARRCILDSRTPSPLDYSQGSSRGRSLDSTLVGLEESPRPTCPVRRRRHQQNFARYPGSSPDLNRCSADQSPPVPQSSTADRLQNQCDVAALKRSTRTHGRTPMVTSSSTACELSSTLSSLGGGPHPEETPFSRRLRRIDDLLNTTAARDSGICGYRRARTSTQQQACQDHHPPSFASSAWETSPPLKTSTAKGMSSVASTTQPANTSSYLFGDVNEPTHHQNLYPMRAEAASGADVPTPARREASTDALMATPVRAEAASGADVPTPARCEAATDALMVTPVRAEAASGADVPTPARREASTDALMVTPVRAEAASGADVPTPARCEAATDALMATPVRAEAASGADVNTPARCEASTDALMVTPVRAEAASGADAPTPARREASTDALMVTPVRAKAASGADAPTPARCEASTDALMATPVRAEAASGADANTPARREASTDALMATPVRAEAASGADAPTPARCEAASQDTGRDVLQSAEGVLSGGLGNRVPTSSSEEPQHLYVPTSSESTALMSMDVKDQVCECRVSGRGQVRNEDDVNCSRCLATRLWARRQDTQVVVEFRALRRRERQHRLSLLKREVEGRYAIRLFEASDAADVAPVWPQGEEETVTATSFTLSCSSLPFVGASPRDVSDEMGRGTITNERVADETVVVVGVHGRRASGNIMMSRTPLSSRGSMDVSDAVDPQRDVKAGLGAHEARRRVSPSEAGDGGDVVFAGLSESAPFTSAGEVAVLRAALEEAEPVEMYSPHAAPLPGTPDLAVRDAERPREALTPEDAIARVGDEYTRQKTEHLFGLVNYADTADFATRLTAAADGSAPTRFAVNVLSSHGKSSPSYSAESLMGAPAGEMKREVAPAPQQRGSCGVPNVFTPSVAIPRSPLLPDGQSSHSLNLWTLDRGESEGSGGEEEAITAAGGDEGGRSGRKHQDFMHKNNCSNPTGSSTPPEVGVLPLNTAEAPKGNRDPCLSLPRGCRPTRGDSSSSSSSTSSSSSAEFMVRRIGAQTDMSTPENAAAYSTDRQRATEAVMHADDAAEYPPVAAVGLKSSQARAGGSSLVSFGEAEDSGGGPRESRSGADEGHDHSDGFAKSRDAVGLMEMPSIGVTGACVNGGDHRESNPRPLHPTPQSAGSLRPPPRETARARADMPEPVTEDATASTTSTNSTPVHTPLSHRDGTQRSTSSWTRGQATLTAFHHHDGEPLHSGRVAHIPSSSAAASESVFFSLPSQGASPLAGSDKTPEHRRQRRSCSIEEIMSPVPRRTEAVPAPHALHQRPWSQLRTDAGVQSTVTGVCFLREACHGGHSSVTDGRARPGYDSQRHLMRDDVSSCAADSGESSEDVAHHPTATPTISRQPAHSWTIPLDYTEDQGGMGHRIPHEAYAVSGTPVLSPLSLSVVADGGTCTSMNKLHRHQQTHRRARRCLPPHLRPGRPWAHLLTRGLRTALNSRSNSSSCTDTKTGNYNAREKAHAPPAQRRKSTDEATCADACVPAHPTGSLSSSTSSIADALSAVPQRSGPWYVAPARHRKEKNEMGLTGLAKATWWQSRRSARRSRAAQHAREKRGGVAGARAGARDDSEDGRQEAALPASAAMTNAAFRTTYTASMRSDRGGCTADAAAGIGSLRRAVLPPTSWAEETSGMSCGRLRYLHRQRQAAGPTYVQLHERRRSLHRKASPKVWRSTKVMKVCSASCIRTRQDTSTPNREGIRHASAATKGGTVVWRLRVAPRPRSTEGRRAVQPQEQRGFLLLSTPHAAPAHRSSARCQELLCHLVAADLRGGVLDNASSSALTDVGCPRGSAAESARASDVIRAESPPPPPHMEDTAPPRTLPSQLMRDDTEEGLDDGVTRASAAYTACNASPGLEEALCSYEGVGDALWVPLAPATCDIIPTGSLAGDGGPAALTSPCVAPGHVSPTATPPGGAEGEVLTGRRDVHPARPSSLTEDGDENAKPFDTSGGTTSTTHPLEMTLGIASLFHGGVSATDPELSRSNPGLDCSEAPQVSPPTPQPPQQPEEVLLQCALADVTATAASGVVDVEQHHPATLTAELALSIRGDTDKNDLREQRHPPQALSHSHLREGGLAHHLPQLAQFSHPSPRAASALRAAEPCILAPNAANSKGSTTSPQQETQGRRKVLEDRIDRLEAALLLRSQQQQPQLAERPRLSDVKGGDDSEEVTADYFEAATDGVEEAPCSARAEVVELGVRNRPFPLPGGDQGGRGGAGDAEGGGVRALQGEGIGAPTKDRGSMPCASETRDSRPLAPRSAIQWTASSSVSDSGAKARRAAPLALSTGDITTPVAGGGSEAVPEHGDLRVAVVPFDSPGVAGNQSCFEAVFPVPETHSPSAAPGARRASYTRLADRRYGSMATSAVARSTDPSYRRATASFLISADWRYQRMYVDNVYFPQSTTNIPLQRTEAVSEVLSEGNVWSEAVRDAPVDLPHSARESTAQTDVAQRTSSATNRSLDFFACRCIY
ncbi:hypothetical protein JKF63_06683 [Porcisia hertigi]|uniref:Uncharacterized protein n=1 Tax=Porcisia hertigi TaxID=2761500 RepID=A0A836IU15_9TRYP|nr:hypothetical protein JKF63_06683 [Porcisia hertigi]